MTTWRPRRWAIRIRRRATAGVQGCGSCRSTIAPGRSSALALCSTAPGVAPGRESPASALQRTSSRSSERARRSIAGVASSNGGRKKRGGEPAALPIARCARSSSIREADGERLGRCGWLQVWFPSSPTPAAARTPAGQSATRLPTTKKVARACSCCKTRARRSVYGLGPSSKVRATLRPTAPAQ